MNQVLSSMAAALVVTANLAAAPAPAVKTGVSPSTTPGSKAIPKPASTRAPITSTTSSIKSDSPDRLSVPRRAPNQANVASPYQVGVASWYGKQFHGRTTANGEDFDMFELTAAHRELPLGTYVKVTNLRNRRWIIVRINDRGPFVDGRIMDLSYAAARMLGFYSGLERVRLDVINPETIARIQNY